MDKNNNLTEIGTKISDFLDGIISSIDSTDKKYDKIPPYKSGKKTGEIINSVIDKFADLVFKKK